MKFYTVFIASLITISVTFAGTVNTNHHLEDLNTTSLRQKVVNQLKVLKQLRIKAHDTHVNTAYADVTIRTAQLFLKYSQWDETHQKKLSKDLAAYSQITSAQAEKLAASLPQRELSGTREILAHAIKDIKNRIEHAADFPTDVQFTGNTPIELKGSYFYAHGRPVFPNGLIWQKGGEKNAQAYGGLSAATSPLSWLHPDLTMHFSTNKAKSLSDSRRRFFYVYEGGNYPAKWMAKKYPEIRNGRRGHTGMDIDNPHVIIWEKAWRKNVAKAWKNEPNFAHVYLLANETYYPTAEGQWHADNGVSKFTWNKFRIWLKNKYKNINRLNTVWKKRFSSFEDVKIKMPISPELQGGPIWYDWCKFNMDRVNQWFAMMIDSTLQADPQALGSIKLGTYVTTLSPDKGIDWQSVYQMQGMVSIETRPYPASVQYNPPKYTNYLKEHGYAFRWVRDIATLDFITSVVPDKPIWDSEAHGISTGGWRDTNLTSAYVNAISWLYYLHGNSATSLWHWGRRLDGGPIRRGRSGFFASTLTQPVVLNAYGRTMKQLNAHAKAVVKLARAPKQVYIYYTEASIISDPKYIKDKILRPIVAALNLSGYRVGFVTPSMLKKAQEKHTASQQKLKYQYIVLPPTEYISNDAVQALHQQIGLGSKIVAIGTNHLYSFNEHGIKRNPATLNFLKMVPAVPYKSGRELSGLLCHALTKMGLQRPIYFKRATVSTGKEHYRRLPVLMRCIKTKRGFLVSLVNIGIHPVDIKLVSPNTEFHYARNLLHPLEKVNLSSIRLKSCEVKLIKVFTQ